MTIPLTLQERLRLLPTRRESAHKGAVGRVLVLGRTLGMTGAALLSARAALRMGCGLVTIAAAKSLQKLFEIQSPCLITRPLEDRNGELGPWSHKTFQSLVKTVDSLIVGPGLGQKPPLQFWLRRSLPDLLTNKPAVLDADALNALAEFPQSWPKLHEDLVFTPHPGELARWHKVSTQQLASQREQFLSKTCRLVGGVVLLKGHETLIGQGEKRALNQTGNPGMATAGSGDVLAGILGALLAQGLGAFDAARLGAWIHGRAGDLASTELGQQGLDALALIDSLPKVMLELEQTRSQKS